MCKVQYEGIGKSVISIIPSVNKLIYCRCKMRIYMLCYYVFKTFKMQNNDTVNHFLVDNY